MNSREGIGVSYSYLRRLFNEELNMSITDFLTRTGLKLLKGLLKTAQPDITRNSPEGGI